MRIEVPVIVKDPEVSDFKEIAPTEQIAIEENLFLDGPISPRVALLDFDPENGALAPGVAFLSPAAPEASGAYRIDRPVLPGDDFVSREAAAVSTFGAVHKTLQLFEEDDALGRRVAWAFDAPQLLVVPRAGEWANAYYERESHSLQFFQFHADGRGRPVFTCHSQDIVAHETAHAILDGVAPDLYSAISPQSLAIHESVADLASLLCSIRCKELTRRVLDQTGGRIERSSIFSGLAEQFGAALDRNRPYLRDLHNDRALRPGSGVTVVDRGDPHSLSEVLSGACYSVLLDLYRELHSDYRAQETAREELVGAPEAAYVQSVVEGTAPRRTRDDLAAASKALFIASERLKRTLLRGLDYLPPGDVSFADLARAVLASDRASHPDSAQQRRWFEREFLRRGVVAKLSELEVPTNYSHAALAGVDLEALAESDYVAYEFVRRNRPLFGIPEEASFEVRPRLDVTKRYWHRDGDAMARELLLKASWTELEPNRVGENLPRRRRYLAGATLAIEWSDRPKIRALLRSGRNRAERADTDKLLARLLAADALRLGDAALGPGGLPLRGVIAADVAAGALRVRSAGRMLHVTQERSS